MWLKIIRIATQCLWMIYYWGNVGNFQLKPKVCSRFWFSFLVDILNLKFGCASQAEIWSKLWSCGLIEIWKLSFDQDWCRNLWYDLKAIILLQEFNPLVCVFGNFYETNISQPLIIYCLLFVLCLYLSFAALIRTLCVPDFPFISILPEQERKQCLK